jgi:protein ImuB
MDRMACVDLPVLPLQLLLRRHPDWRTHPVAVVDHDKPQGVILQVNERARSSRILPGMRYAAALSLSGDLRAAVVAPQEIEHEVRATSQRLQYFTPHVESAAGEPGVFWLDASGLERLHDSLAKWAELIRSDFGRRGLDAAVVVGFSRFGSYALAKAGAGRVVVHEDPLAEREAARRVPLDRLHLEPRIREMLHKLGVRILGEFLDLPVEGVARRFGPEVHRLHRLASDMLRVPLQPDRLEEDVWQRMALDHPEADVVRLMRVIERLIDPLLRTLADRGQALTEVRVGLRFERMGDHIERLRPAAPTLSAGQLSELIRLRIEAVRKLPDGVVEVMLIGRGAPATRRQLELFNGRPRRDLAAADRALARVRAELGDEAVGHLGLREGHLPEGRFTWEPLPAMVAARPRTEAAGGLVRRIYAQPVPLPARPRQEPDGWMLHGLEQGPVVRVLGPYVVSGGWWRKPVHREYHFAETQKGDLLWVYYDRARRRWFLQGRVE